MIPSVFMEPENGEWSEIFYLVERPRSGLLQFKICDFLWLKQFETEIVQSLNIFRFEFFKTASIDLKFWQ